MLYEVIMKICFLFPGYGSQFVGMGKDFYDEYRIVQEYFEQASHCLDSNFIKLCFASSDVELSRVENALPSIFLLSVSLCSLLKSRGIVPDVVAGFNNGEYAALYAAGGINFPDGLYMIKKYALFYQELLTTLDVQMVSITGISSAQIKKLCTQISTKEVRVDSALVIQDSHVIVSGHTAAVQALCNVVNEQKKVHVTDVDLAYGLHSPLMSPVLKSSEPYISVIDVNNLSIPMVRGLDAKTITTSKEVNAVLLKSLEHAVQWRKVVKALEFCDIFVTIGPAEFLSNLIKKNYPDKLSVGIAHNADIEKLKSLIHDNRMNGEQNDGV